MIPSNDVRSAARPLLPASLLLLLLCAPSPAEASGSVSLTVASKRHSVTVTQTFRRILARGQSRGYIDSVQKNFLAICARLTPRLDRLLQRPESKQARGLGDYDLALRTIEARPGKPGLVLAHGAFPALVELPRIQTRNDRLAYTIHLPFRTRPDRDQLTRLHLEIARLVEAHADREEAGAGPAQRLSPVSEAGASVRVTLTPGLWVAPAEARRLQQRLGALARTARAALEARMKSASGVTFAPLTPGLKYYGDTKRLPGLAAVSLWGRGLEARAIYALAAVKGPAELDALRTALYAELEQAVAPR